MPVECLTVRQALFQAVACTLLVCQEEEKLIDRENVFDNMMEKNFPYLKCPLSEGGRRRGQQRMR